MMTPDIAWLTGFYEGEGCIVAYIYDKSDSRNGTYRNLIFTLAQKGRWPLKRAYDILVRHGINPDTLYLKPVKKRPGVYTLTCNTFDEIDKIIALMWIGLSPRRKQQIQEALHTFCEEYEDSLVGDIRGNGFKSRDSEYLWADIKPTFKYLYSDAN